MHGPRPPTSERAMSARASAAKRQRPRLASSAVSSSSFKRACFTHGQRVAMEAGRVTPASSGTAVSQTSQQQRTAVLGPVVSEPPQSPWPVLHTRGGKFRADDAIACMLLKCLPKYQRSGVFGGVGARTRSPRVPHDTSHSRKPPRVLHVPLPALQTCFAATKRHTCACAL